VCLHTCHGPACLSLRQPTCPSAARALLLGEARVTVDQHQGQRGLIGVSSAGQGARADFGQQVR
jgi:hypothetical protein